MVYHDTRPRYGAPPAGYCWETHLRETVHKAGGMMSQVMEGVAHFPSGKEVGRMGIIVDDMLITVPRNNPELARHIMKVVTDAYGDVRWDWDPVEFSFGGPQILRDVMKRTVTFHIRAKIEAAIATFKPELLNSVASCNQVSSEKASEALVMEPKETRSTKLSKEQRQVLSQVGALIYFMEYFIHIVYPVHALTCVMSYPPVAECQVVIDGIWAYVWANRSDGNSFGGELSNVEITMGYKAIEEVPHAQCMLASDATWTGSEMRSLKVYAVQWAGGTLMARLKSIHAVMPSSFMAEADALHDGFEAGEYIKDALVEFGLMAPAAIPALVDNEGLVKTTQLKAKGGSKLHRRKLAIILQQIKENKFKVFHTPDKAMPVDFMSKLVSARKLRMSIDRLYNTAHRVTQGVPYKE
jgi:hypothetical protein